MGVTRVFVFLFQDRQHINWPVYVRVNIQVSIKKLQINLLHKNPSYATIDRNVKRASPAMQCKLMSSVVTLILLHFPLMKLFYCLAGLTFLDVIVTESAAIFQLLAGEDQTLLIWGDS